MDMIGSPRIMSEEAIRWEIPRSAGLEHFARVELVLRRDPSETGTIIRVELVANNSVTLASFTQMFLAPRRK